MNLWLIVGCTKSTCSLILCYGRFILIKILQNNNLARIRMPTESEWEKYTEAVKLRQPLVGTENAGITVDGLK